MTRRAPAAVVLTLLTGLAPLALPPPPSAAAPEPAVPGEWSRHAPEGIFETVLSVSPSDPNLVYAALGEGVARSADGGLTWEHLGVDEGFGASFSIDNQVEIDPTTDSRVYVATYTGVRRSTDDGGSFPLVGTAPGTGLDSIVRAIGVDAGAGPADTRILATGYVQRVALSTDSGSTWTNKTGNAAAAGLGFGDATVVLHPTDPDLAFLASDGVIMRTVNLTATTPTWAAIDTATVNGNVLDLTIAGNRLLAATSTGQVFRSTDALVKTTPSPVWAGANIDHTGAAADLFAVGPTVFVSTGEGVFKTTDVTVSVPMWSELGGGLPGSGSEAVAGTPDGSTLYAQAGTSIYRSENGGLSWTERGGPVQRTVRDIDSGGGRTFAGSDTGLLRSLDGGLTWSVVPSTTGQEVIALAVAPSAPARVFARLDGDVRRSTDGGLTFAAAVPTAPEDVVALAVDPADPDVAWATGGFEAVFRTADGGATWTQIPAALLPDSFRAEDIEIAPAAGATPSAVFLSGDEGFVLASVDDGASWVQQSTGLPGGSNDVGDVAIDPADPRHLVATVDLNGALYESTNSGGTWTVVPGTDEEENPSALEVVQIDAVTFSPVDGSILIATGWGFEESGRVYRSGDGGATFVPFDPAMDMVYNDAFEILADDQGVHVATQRSGVLDLVRAADVRSSGDGTHGGGGRRTAGGHGARDVRGARPRHGGDGAGAPTGGGDVALGQRDRRRLHARRHRRVPPGQPARHGAARRQRHHHRRQAVHRHRRRAPSRPDAGQRRGDPHGHGAQGADPARSRRAPGRRHQRAAHVHPQRLAGARRPPRARLQRTGHAHRAQRRARRPHPPRDPAPRRRRGLSLLGGGDPAFRASPHPHGDRHASRHPPARGAPCPADHDPPPLTRQKSADPSPLSDGSARKRRVSDRGRGRDRPRRRRPPRASRRSASRS